MGILDNKVAIITGAGKGIGEGEAYALAKEGAKVVVVSRTLGDVEKVADNVQQLGGEALPMACDVRLKSDVDRVVAATIEKFGGVDILVNNAQIMFEPHAIETWTEQEMRDIWDSGFLGTWLFMVACFPHMKENGGRIVNTGSAAGFGDNYVGHAGYGPAKEAVRSLTRYAAREWGQYGINVNVINPFAWTAAAADFFDNDQEKLLNVANIPLPRIGDCEKDIGRTVVFLCGPDSGMITGCTISADGGGALI